MTSKFRGSRAWDDLRIEPVARTTGSNTPSFEKWFDNTPGTSRGVYLYSFSNELTANQREIFFSMQMPHDWDSGVISVHVHWVPADSQNTAVVIWGLEYCWAEIGTEYSDTTIVYSSATLVPGDTNLTAFRHYISEFADLTPSASQDGFSSVLIGRLFRRSGDASDTYDDKAGLLYIDAHYVRDGIGTITEYAK
jgi:hypothetical protein